MLSGYPDSFLQSLIWDLNAYNIDEADPEEQQLFKTCLDLLCERKDPEAIETRGYCYYNGTAIYPQDWFKARDSFLELYQLTGSPFAANTLGYIYYYGRCSKGKPDYPQAFYYFSIGHAGGLYESTYKLGDMFFHGLSVAKNTDIAYSLYKTVYDENMDRFVSGDTRCKFADTALRMARCYMGTDPRVAYGYCLQARLAIRFRLRDDPQYGDEKIRQNIENQAEEIRKVYTAKARTLRSPVPFWLEWVEKNSNCLLFWKPLKDGKYSLLCKIVSGRPFDSKILATCPECDYCGLQEFIRIQTAPGTTIIAPEGLSGVLFDGWEHDFEDNQLQLFRTGESVVSIYTKEYRFVIPKADPDTVEDSLFPFHQHMNHLTVNKRTMALQIKGDRNYERSG